MKKCRPPNGIKNGIENISHNLRTENVSDNSDFIKNIQNFYSSLEMKIFQCNICYEECPLPVYTKSLKEKTEYYACSQCKTSKKKNTSKFSKENKIVLNKIPDTLKNSTQSRGIAYISDFCKSYKLMQNLMKATRAHYYSS